MESHMNEGRSNPGGISPLNRRALLFVVGALLLFGCSGSEAPTYTATIADGRAAALELLDEHGTSAISVALVDGERVIRAESFGMADREARKPATPNTGSGIGSVSKIFAATAVMILVDRNMISLGEPRTSYLDDFRMISPEYASVTVRMLLNHSSGFPGTDYVSATTFQPLSYYAAQLKESLKTQWW
jgi:CubicO group peptidase (beta-lactamase class C family)